MKKAKRESETREEPWQAEMLGDLVWVWVYGCTGMYMGGIDESGACQAASLKQLPPYDACFGF